MCVSGTGKQKVKLVDLISNSPFEPWAAFEDSLFSVPPLRKLLSAHPSCCFLLSIKDKVRISADSYFDQALRNNGFK